ncbi:MAG TPA: AEC family transporter [Candidatus Methylacidiphilales bacterium]|nr:AEC family transporter [Candidatus Methylacidiphilales bacterium]
MHEYLQVLGGVLPLFLIMGVGAVVRRAGLLNEQADRSILNLCVHLLLPCLILDHLIASPALRQPGNLLLSPLVGFVATAGSLFVAGITARLWRLEPNAARTFRFVAGIYNYGYIPVPLIATLYGNTALAVLFLFNLGTETAFWIAGFAPFMGHSPLRDWRRTFTSPVRAIILGVAINLITARFGVLLDDATLATAAWGWPVKVVLDVVHLIGFCSIPVALIVIGATMADFWSEFHASVGWGVMALAVLVRNAICPLGMVLLAMALPVSRELKETLVVQAAMPAGVFTLLLTRHNGGSVPVALQVIFSTSAAALITLPLWIHFGMKLIGN